MSRIFTIWFDFEEVSYMGIVTMVRKEGEYILKVEVKEDKLLKLLRGKNVILSTSQGILAPDLSNNDRLCSLVLNIVESIASHLSNHSSNKGME